MFKNLLDRLKGLPPDPTADWPQLNPTTPAIDWSGGTIGGVRFRANLESARGVFGKPSEVKWIDKNYCSLIYASAGFEVDFQNDRLASAAILTQIDCYSSAGITPTSSQIDGFSFSQHTTLDDVTRRFDKAEQPHDVDDEEIIVTYERHGLSVEFEFTLERTLKRLNLFLIEA